MNKTPEQQQAMDSLASHGYTFSLAMNDGSFLFTHNTEQAGANRQNKLAMVTPDARIVEQN